MTVHIFDAALLIEYSPGSPYFKRYSRGFTIFGDQQSLLGRLVGLPRDLDWGGGKSWYLIMSSNNHPNKYMILVKYWEISVLCHNKKTPEI